MPEFSSIEQYHAALEEGSTNCVKVVTHFLEKIDSLSRLNAFVRVYREEALARAAELDQQRAEGRGKGRLHGVVIGIKDVLALKDHPLTAASNILRADPNDSSGKDFISLYTATAVQRLIDEESIIIGHLNCDEFAMGSANVHSAFGPVLNALDETRVPGGSSGGSAVAVQAGLCMASLGSDTGGSVRQPADFCGIVGLKPGYGCISRHGLVAYASSFDQVGIFTKNASDAALLLEVMAGPDEFDGTASRQKPQKFTTEMRKGSDKYRIAWFPQALDHPGLDPQISSSIREKLKELKDLSHQVEPVEFDLLDYLVPAYYVLTTAEASSNLSRYDGIRFGYRSGNDDLEAVYTQSRSRGFGKEVKRRIMLGSFVLSAGHYDAYFTRAQRVRRLVKEKTARIFSHYDFIIIPTAPLTAPKFDETSDPIATYLSDIYTVMANLAGIPAISLPLFWHNNGLPFGLQVMCERFNEVSLLRFSEMLMQSGRPR